MCYSAIYNYVSACQVEPLGAVKSFFEVMKLWGNNPAILSDIIAFDIGVLLFWIPLSINIISRISDRYNSEVIVGVFERRWENRWLPKLLTASLTIAVPLKFMMTDVIYTFENIFMWIVLILFLITLFIVYASIKTVTDYSCRTDDILKGLINDAQKIFQK
jgi:hypothetical protein